MNNENCYSDIEGEFEAVSDLSIQLQFPANYSGEVTDNIVYQEISNSIEFIVDPIQDSFDDIHEMSLQNNMLHSSYQDVQLDNSSIITDNIYTEVWYEFIENTDESL